MFFQLCFKKDAMICGKCLYLPKESKANLNWWIEMHKKAGFNSIYLCEQDLEDDEDGSYAKLFAKHKDFVHLDNLKCLPNFFRNLKVKYHSSLFQTDVFTQDLFNQIYLNNCYMKYVDQYKYIAVIDIDEIFTPQHTTEFFTQIERKDFIRSLDKLENYKHMNTSNLNKQQQFECSKYLQEENKEQAEYKFEPYLNDLLNLSRKTSQDERGQAFYFNHGFFLHTDMMDQFFTRFDAYLNTNFTLLISEDNTFTKISFPILDTSRVKQFWNGSHAFFIKIESQQELHYAINMLKIYKKVLKPYLEANKAEIDLKTGGQFDRFFTVAHQGHAYSLGKTLHNTLSTYEFTLHFKDWDYEYIKSNETFLIKEDKHHTRYNYFVHSITYLSHFRERQNFHHKSFSIDAITLDLNYFYCYFLPLISN
jgi:hypothetical protein